VNDEMHLEIVCGLEALVTVVTLIHNGTVCHLMPSEVSLTGKHFLTLVTWIVVGAGDLVLLKTLFGCVSIQTDGTAEISTAKVVLKVLKTI